MLLQYSSSISYDFVKYYIDYYITTQPHPDSIATLAQYYVVVVSDGRVQYLDNHK